MSTRYLIKICPACQPNDGKTLKTPGICFKSVFFATSCSTLSLSPQFRQPRAPQLWAVFIFFVQKYLSIINFTYILQGGLPLFSNRDLRRLLIPLVLEQVLSGLMGIADTMMVTRVGDTAISAVSCVDSLNTLVFYLLSALANGGTIVCAQYLGRRDKESAARAGQQVFLVSAAVALLLSALGLLFHTGLLRLIFGQVEEAIMAQAAQYFLITALSYPFLAIAQSSAAQFRAGGNSRLPMLVTALANCVNIAGNAVLIFGFQLGVSGAAIATLFSRIVNAVVLLILQRDPELDIPFRDYRSIRPRRQLIAAVCRIAIPTGIENSLFQLGRLLVQSTVSTLGTTAIAAQAMTYTLDAIQSMPGMAFGIGLLTVAGQCMGAGRPEEAKQYTKKLCVTGWLVLLCAEAAVLLATKPITALSGLSAPAAGLTFRLMIAITLVKTVCWVPSFTLPNTLRASGDVAYSAAVSAGSMWLFRVLGSAILCRVLGFGLEGVWIAWFLDWVCRDVCYITRYLRGKWQSKTVLAASNE